MLRLLLVRSMIVLNFSSEAPFESRFMMYAICRTGTPPAANIWNRRSRSSARSTFRGAKGSAVCSCCRRASEVSFDPSGEVRCDSAKERRSEMFFSQDGRDGLFGGSGILDIASQIRFKAACCRLWYSIPATRTCLRALAWGRQASLTRVAAISSSASARGQAIAVVRVFWPLSTRCDAAAPTASSSHPCICNSSRSSRSISATAWLMSNDSSVLPDGRRLGPTCFTDQPCYNPATAVNTLSEGAGAHLQRAQRNGVCRLLFGINCIAKSLRLEYTKWATIHNHRTIGSCATEGLPSPMQRCGPARNSGTLRLFNSMRLAMIEEEDNG